MRQLCVSLTGRKGGVDLVFDLDLLHPAWRAAGFAARCLGGPCGCGAASPTVLVLLLFCGARVSSRAVSLVFPNNCIGHMGV